MHGASASTTFIATSTPSSLRNFREKNSSIDIARGIASCMRGIIATMRKASNSCGFARVDAHRIKQRCASSSHRFDRHHRAKDFCPKSPCDDHRTRSAAIIVVSIRSRVIVFMGCDHHHAITHRMRKRHRRSRITTTRHRAHRSDRGREIIAVDHRIAKIPDGGTKTPARPRNRDSRGNWRSRIAFDPVSGPPARFFTG